MKGNLTASIILVLAVSITSFSQTIKVTFSGKDALTAAVVPLDSVRIENLTTLRDTVLRSNFVIDLEGVTGIGEHPTAIPRTLELSGNFANPFVDETRFQIGTSQSGMAEILLYSLNGELLASIQEALAPGWHEFVLKGRGLSPGVYLLVPRSDGRSSSVKILKTGSATSERPSFSYLGFSATNKPSVVRKSHASANYRFIGYASLFSPDSVLASPTADTTVEFRFHRIPVDPTITRFTAARFDVQVGDSVHFEISSRDDNGDLAMVLIDYHGNGLFDDSTAISGGSATETFAYSFIQPGSYRPEAVVVDGAGHKTRSLLDTVIAVKPLSDQPPELLSFTADRLIRAKNLEITLTALVRDIDADLEFVRIDFDSDGKFDDSLKVTLVTSEPDTIRFVTRYYSKGVFRPSIQLADKRNHTLLRAMDTTITIEDAIVSPQTRVLLKNEIVNSGITYDSTWTFFIPSAKVGQLGLQVGSVLVSDTGLGFLRRVVRIDTIVAGILAGTEQGLLTDVFEQVKIELHKTLTPDMIASLHQKEGVHEVSSVNPITIYINDIVLYDKDGNFGTTNDQIRVDGSVAIEPTIDLEIEIDWPLGNPLPIIKRAIGSVTIRVTPELNAKYQVELASAEKEMLVTLTPFTPIVILIGPVPLVFSPQMRTYVGVKGDITAGASLNSTLECEFTAGVQYQNGQWSGIGHGTHSFSPPTPSFSIGGTARVYAAERFVLLLYGLVGPYQSTSIYGELDVDLLRNPLAEVYAGIEAGAGFMVDFLGTTLAKFEKPDVFGMKVKLWDSGNAKMPKVTTVNPAIVMPNLEMGITGEFFGSSQGSSKVYFRGGDIGNGNFYLLPAQDYLSWSHAEIRVRVPAGVNADGLIYVNVGGRISNEVPFQINRLPILTTTTVSNITTTSANSGGTITSDGGFPVTARGVFWSTLSNPTIANTKTNDGTGTGTFTSNLTGLASNTTYYARAYATNSAGTGYGDELSFITTQGQEPVLTTATVTNITQTSAKSGGTITSDGGFPVTARGVCWSTTPSPTILNSKTTDGAGVGSFVSNLTGLTANTVYYVRAYATNSTGTGYGDEVSFTAQQGGGGETVTIGTQVWMLKNLNVTTYRNGDPIPQVTDPTQWANLTTGAWCYYNNDPAMGAIYGKLYNWYAVNDSRGLAPTGWHVPTDAEWKTLEMYLGMTQSQADATGWRGTDEGGKLKETGTTHWNSPNTGATNSSGFTALPGGYRYGDGTFFGVGFVGSWWSSTEFGAASASSRRLSFNGADVYRLNFYSKDFGFSVRCVRD